MTSHNTTHSIGHLTFNLADIHGSAMPIANEPLNHVVYKVVLPAIERVFNDLGLRNIDLVVDDVVIDDIEIPAAALDVSDYGSTEKNKRFERQFYVVLKNTIEKKIGVLKRSQQLSEKQKIWLANVFKNANKRALTEHWKTLFCDQKSGFLIWLFTALQSQKNRRFVAKDLSNEMLVNILELLDPVNATFVIRLIGQANVFSGVGTDKITDNLKDHKNKVDTAIKVKSNPHNIHARKQLVEFSLAYLTCERGGMFNKKSYLRSVLRQMARHHNQNISTVCQNIHLELASVTMDADIKTHLLEIVNTEYAESKGFTEITEFTENVEFKESTESKNHFNEHDNQKHQITTKIHTQASQRDKQQYAKHAGDIQTLSPLLHQLIKHWTSDGLVVKEVLYDDISDTNLSHSFGITALSRAIDSALNGAPKTLRKLLLASSDRPSLIGQLCRALPASLLHRLAHAINPTVYLNFGNHGRLLQRLLQDAGFNAASGLKSTLYWQACLHYLFHYADANYFSIDELLVFLLNQVQKETGQIKSAVAQKCLQSLSALPLNHIKSSAEIDVSLILKSYCRKTLQHTKQNESKWAQSTVSESERDEPELSSPHDKDQQLLASTLQKLEIALLSGKWHIEVQHWAILNNQAQPALENVLYKHLKRSTSRRFFIESIPIEAQYGLLTVLNPQASKAMQSIWRFSDSISLLFDIQTTQGKGYDRRDPKAYFSQHNTAGQTPPSSTTNPTLSYVLKEFVLSYLVNDRGSEFNQRSFARSTLRQLSAHYNMHYDEVLAHCQAAAIDGSLPSVLKNQWMDVLGISRLSAIDKQSLVSVDQCSDSAEADKHRKRQSRGAKLYDTLWAMACGHNLIKENQWRIALQNLGAHHPHYLQRFVSELQTGAIALHRFVGRISAKSLQHLLNAVLNVTGHSNPRDGSGVRRAMDQYAAVSVNQILYYLTCIQSVLSGGVIDLQHIEAATFKRHSALDTRTQNLGSKNHPQSAIAAAVMGTRIHTKSTKQHSYADSLKQLQAVCSHADSARQFAHLSESDQLAVFNAVDARKTALLLPVSQLLRNALLGCGYPLNYQHINIWACQSLGRQLVQTASLANVDRFIQIKLQALLRLLKNTHSVGFDALQKNLLQRVLQIGALNKSATSVLAANINVTQVVDSVSSLKAFELLSDQPEIICSPDDASTKSETSEHLNKRVNMVPDEAMEATETREATEIIETIDSREPIPVSYAGIVAIAPYIPMLFDKLGLLEQQKFTQDLDKAKAFAVLHYLSTGINLSEQNTKVGLALHKLLCGLDINASPERIYTLSDEQKDVCNSLLAGVIQHWKALGNTTMEGLQEIFLQRSGVMVLDEEKGWMLSVESRPFDVLLDRLPWSYSTLKYQFMADAIYVEWRKS